MPDIPHYSPDFSSDSFQQDIYSIYRHMLESLPVFSNDEGIVYLTRHAHVCRLLSDKSFKRRPIRQGCSPFTSDQREPTPTEEMINHWMLFMDPPRHDIVRKAFMTMFTAKNISSLEPRIREQVRELIDALPESGPMELVQQLAFPLPVLVIADILGVPKSDQEQFQAWSAILTRALDDATEEGLRRGDSVTSDFRQYFEDLVSNPESLPDYCLVRSLIEDRDCGLTTDELLYGFVLLLWAGQETTKNLISNGILLLSQFPEQQKYLVQQPELVNTAVEEIVRFECPIQKLSRWAHADVQFDDYTVPAGTMVTALVGAANRDETVFDDPDSFDIRRRKSRHIAFGSGFHHCLGALLARTESRIVFQQLAPLLPELTETGHSWRNISAFRSLGELHMDRRAPC
jgi:cytochrome P450